MASKEFVLDMGDEGNGGGDNLSVVSYDDDDIDEDRQLDDFSAAPVHGEDEASFFAANPDLDNDLPLDDEGMDELSDDDGGLQGYEDYARSSSPVSLQGYNDYAGADFEADAAEEEDSNSDVAAPGAKRVKRTKVATQPAHFDQTTKHAERSAKRVTIDPQRSFLIDDGAGLAYTAPSRVPGTFGRRNREKGSTLPAYHKKVTHELDSDDELMMAMRDKGYSDKQISERLLKEGRVKYDPKSVSTRVQRIKQEQAKRSDWELENGIKEWTFEDDRLLLRAFDIADIEIAYEIERLRAWRFKKAADWMRRLNKDSFFSGKACRERYSALMSGIAAIPTAVSDDPVAAKAALEQFRQECEDAREKEREKEENATAERQRVKEEAQARTAQEGAVKARKRLNDAEAKHDRQASRAAAQALKKAQAAENLKRKQAAAAEKEAKRQASIAERKFREEMSLKHFKHVNENSPDPRRSLSVADLRKLCEARKIPYHKKRGEAQLSAEELVAKLRESDDNLKVKQLTDMLKAQKIPTGGTKLQMKYQLAFAAARSCPSYVPDEVDADGDDEAEAGIDAMAE